MSELNIALAVVGGLVLALGLLSGLVRRSLLSEPLVALLVGVLLGPAAFGLLDLLNWGHQQTILEQATRLTLAIGLIGVALRLPKGEPFRRWWSLTVLLGLVMPLMWLTSSLLVYLILGLPFLVALLIGAVITPTDPVVSSTIVVGQVAEKNLPADIRHTLSAESGANDGLAFPYVFLPNLQLAHPPEEALLNWLTHRPLSGMVRPDRRGGPLLRQPLPARNGGRGSLGGREPRHMLLHTGPRPERHAPHQALRKARPARVRLQRRCQLGRSETLRGGC